MKVNMFAVVLMATAVLTQTACASSTAHPVSESAKEISTALPPNPVHGFTFSISEGQNKWEVRTQLQTPAAVGTSATRLGHCQFNGAPGEKSDMTFNMVDGTSISVVPLQQTSKGVYALIRIETSSSHVDAPAISWKVGTTTHVCSIPQGSVKTHVYMASRFLEFGNPEKLTLSEQSVYEITATAGAL